MPARRIEIDMERVERLASLGTSPEEIADRLGVSERTIRRRCAAPIKKGAANLRNALRSKQVEVAMAGNVAMLIWLGKQYLGQTDRRDVTTGGNALPAVRYVWSDGGEVTEPWHETTE